MKGKLLFLAVSACFAIMLCRFHFHFLIIITTITLLLFLLIKNERSLFLLCMATILLFIGIFSFTERSNHTLLNEGSYTTSGVISSIPSIDGNQFKGYLENDSGEKLIFYYKIKSLAEKEALKGINPGTACRFQGELVVPKSPTMPNAFDYKQYLYNHHIHWQYFVEEINDCQVEKKDLLLTLMKVRKGGLSFIEKHFPASSVGIVQALLFGEIDLLEQDVEDAYQELGIVHLLAISGSHVTLLVSGLYFLFIYFGVTHEKTRIVFIVLLPIYMILTGASPSVIRACFMAIVYFLLKLFKLRSSTLDVISFTFLVLLAINPYYLFQVGFQLSYAVTFGLLLSIRIVEQFASWLMKLTVISGIAQLCSLPLLLFHFYEVSLISLPMNMVFVPLYSFLILPGAIITTVITAAFPLIGNHLIAIYSDLLLLTHKFVLFASEIPQTMLTTGKLSIFILMALIIVIIYFFIRFEKRQRVSDLYRPAVCFILVFLTQVMIPYFQPFGKVLVIDVGQGDSIFIQRPFNKGNYLIDTGGRIRFPQEEWEERMSTFSIAKNVTIPYFKSIGVTKLDALFLTHGDLDHVGEVLSVLEEISVKELIIPKGFVRGELEQKIIQAAEMNRVKVTTVQAGDRLVFQNHSFYIVSPVELTESKNDDSLVVWTELGGLRWLFTGDAEMDAEKKMIKNYPSLKADVVKIGHHGSKGSTSEQFLDHVKPKIALVSAGLNNRYQHPHTEVLDQLAARNIALFRTDLDGAILYHFKGKAGTFSTYPPYDKVNQ